MSRRPPRSWRTGCAALLAGTLAAGIVGLPAVVAAAEPPLRPDNRPVGAADRARAVEQWVVATSPRDERIRGASDRLLLDLFVRCVDVPPGFPYCLQLGWEQEADDPQARTALLDRLATRPAGTAPGARTGAAGLVGQIRAFARQPFEQRQAAEAAEVRQAFQDVTKLVRDKDWLDWYRRTRSGPAEASEPCPAEGCPPERAGTIEVAGYSSQERNYWCGAAVAQMLGRYGGREASQGWWWDEVGISPDDGSSSWNIRAALNRHTTKWVNSPYILGHYHGYDPESLYARVVRNIWKFDQPMSISVMLWRQWFPYLAGDRGQHFQAVVGYDDNARGRKAIWIMEPLDEARFGWGPPTGGVHDIGHDVLYGAMVANEGILVY